MGQNVHGELGDGTRVPRLEPIHIADNVAYAGRFFFLKHDGTLWSWESDNPTPQQVFEGVAVATDQRIHFDNGVALDTAGTNLSLLTLSEWSSEREDLAEAGRIALFSREVENVAVPSIIIFE